MELLFILVAALFLLSLPVIFLMGFGRPERGESGPRREAPGAPFPGLPGLGPVTSLDPGADRVTSEEALRALEDLETILDRFDRQVRRIEGARLRGEYRSEDGDGRILRSVFAPVKKSFAEELEAAGRSVGFGDPEADVELTPLRSAYIETSRLPGEVERAWLSGRSLAELEARELVRLAIESARDWIDER